MKIELNDHQSYRNCNIRQNNCKMIFPPYRAAHMESLNPEEQELHGCRLMLAVLE